METQQIEQHQTIFMELQDLSGMCKDVLNIAFLIASWIIYNESWPSFNNQPLWLSGKASPLL